MHAIRNHVCFACLLFRETFVHESSTLAPFDHYNRRTRHKHARRYNIVRGFRDSGGGGGGSGGGSAAAAGGGDGGGGTNTENPLHPALRRRSVAAVRALIAAKAALDDRRIAYYSPLMQLDLLDFRCLVEAKTHLQDSFWALQRAAAANRLPQVSEPSVVRRPTSICTWCSHIQTSARFKWQAKLSHQASPSLCAFTCVLCVSAFQTFAHVAQHN